MRMNVSVCRFVHMHSLAAETREGLIVAEDIDGCERTEVGARN